MTENKEAMRVSKSLAQRRSTALLGKGSRY